MALSLSCGRVVEGWGYLAENLADSSDVSLIVLIRQGIPQNSFSESMNLHPPMSRPFRAVDRLHLNNQLR